MKQSTLARLLGYFFKRPAANRTPIRRTRLNLDNLEARDVMTATVTAGWLAPPSAGDLFNASNATVVAGSSTYSNDYNLNHLIDGNPSDAEPNNTIFADGQNAGFTDYAVIRTNSPVNLSDFRILLGQDGVGNANRSADAVRLYASADGVSFQMISQASNLSTNDVDPNNGNTGYAFTGNDAWLTVSDSFSTPVSAQFFRIEVDRHGSVGARVFEIDGFGTIDTSTPPPGTATVTPGFVGAVADDLFDPSQGAAIIGSSTYNSDFGIKKMTDGAAAASESNHTIFADGQPAGSTDYAVVRTAAPAQLSGYRLTLGQDGLTDSNRSADAIRVYASMDGITYTLISSATNLTAGQSAGYGYRYGNNTSTISENFASPISAQFFKLEIDRHGTSGVRVMEFDGFGTAGLGFNHVDSSLLNSNTNDVGNGDQAPGFTRNDGLNADAIEASLTYPGFNPASAFGAASSLHEATNLVFADGESEHRIHWTASQPLTLTGYQIGLVGDGDSSSRAAGRVELYAGIGQASQLVDVFDNLSMSGNVARMFGATLFADTFELRITPSGTSGVRITEIDAIVSSSSPTFLEAEYAWTIDENASAQTVGTIAATTSGGNSILYSLESGASGFYVNATSGVVSYLGDEPLDFEANPTYVLLAGATDSTGAKSFVPISITLLDIAENPVQELNSAYQRMQRAFDRLESQDEESVTPLATHLDRMAADIGTMAASLQANDVPSYNAALGKLTTDRMNFGIKLQILMRDFSRVIDAGRVATEKSRGEAFVVKGIRSELNKLVQRISIISTRLSQLSASLETVYDVVKLGGAFALTLNDLESNRNALVSRKTQVDQSRTDALAATANPPAPSNNEEVQALNAISNDVNGNFDSLLLGNTSAAQRYENTLDTLSGYLDALESTGDYAEYAFYANAWAATASTLGDALNNGENAAKAKGSAILAKLQTAADDYSQAINFRRLEIQSDRSRLKAVFDSFESGTFEVSVRLFDVRNDASRPPAFEEATRIDAALSTLGIRISEIEDFLENFN